MTTPNDVYDSAISQLTQDLVYTNIFLDNWLNVFMKLDPNDFHENSMKTENETKPNEKITFRSHFWFNKINPELNNQNFLIFSGVEAGSNAEYCSLLSIWYEDKPVAIIAHYAVNESERYNLIVTDKDNYLNMVFYVQQLFGKEKFIPSIEEITFDSHKDNEYLEMFTINNYTCSLNMELFQTLHLDD